MKIIHGEVDRPGWEGQILPVAKIESLETTTSPNRQTLAKEVVKLAHRFIRRQRFHSRHQFLLVMFPTKIFDHFRKAEWKLNYRAVATNVLQSVERSRACHIWRGTGLALTVANIARPKLKKTVVSRHAMGSRDPTAE